MGRKGITLFVSAVMVGLSISTACASSGSGTLYSNGKVVTSTQTETQYPELKKGSKGEKVKALQKRLKELGFYTGKIDGDYGKNTVAAVKSFEAFNGIEESGVASSEVQALLYSDDAKGILNPENRNRFIAQGQELFSFLTLTGENDFDICNPKRIDSYVFATARSGDGKEYPICYMAEGQKVYCVSVIEKKKGNIETAGYQKCVIAMAKSLNYQATDEEILKALKMATKNSGVGVMTISNDMQLIYESDEGMLTISF